MQPISCYCIRINVKFNRIFDRKKKKLFCKLRVEFMIPLVFSFAVRVKCLFQILWIQKLSLILSFLLTYVKNGQWCSELPALNYNPSIYFPIMQYKQRLNLLFLWHKSKGTCGCVYLRVQDYNEISVKIVASKTIIAPVRKITLSCLELIAWSSICSSFRIRG